MRSKYIFILYFTLVAFSSFAHDQIVHEAITINAASSAHNDSPAYAGFINVISSDCSLFTATNSMRIGSYDEDFADEKGDVGGKRSLNHFYDPLGTTSYGKGLSDGIFAGTGSIGDKRELIGTNSFSWASISNCVGINFPGEYGLGKNENTMNIWSWPNARYYEWVGLTATNKADRNTYLTNMFRAVGQVMHLLEDTSQPQHVRNEQHLDQILGINTPWRSPIEDYGLLNVKNLNYGDGSMLNWQAAGFTNLEDFWNTHKYNGSSSAALIADNKENPNGGPNTLGLAEWCNANFLGDRHQYADYYLTNDIKYYPYPRRSGTIAPQVDSITIKNGRVLSRYYLSKTTDGIPITHHSALTLWGMEHPEVGNKAKTTTIRDDNVLKDYHNVFIPKAVKYSAGLIDYFFRGTMNVSVIGCGTNSSQLQYTNLIVNTSGDDFKNGTFYIYQNDSSSNRTLIAYTNLSAIVSGGVLSDGQSAEMTFPVTSSFDSTNQFLLVYQGTISTPGAADDPVDAGIALAAQTFSPGAQTLEYDYLVSDDFLPTLPATISTNLASGDFSFPLIDGHYQVLVTGGWFDDAGTIGGVPTTVSGSECGAPATFGGTVVVPPDAVSIVGNHLEVNLTCTDNCRVLVGWQGITITWIAWPAN